MQKTIFSRVAPSAMLPRTARTQQLRRPAFRQAPPRRASFQPIVVASSGWAPPTVAEAKRRFVEAYPRPLPALYSTVIQELLVQQHIFRWNKNYMYSEVTALGICSIFEQVLDGLPEEERNAVFNAFITALQEDPNQYRADAARLEEWARSASAADVIPSSDGSDGQQVLSKVADATKESRFLYTKFFAIGLFRILELAGGKDPKALGAVVTALGVPQERVNADLLTYKGVLSKLQGAKEIMKEFIEREKKKTAERAAAKAAKAAASTTGDASPQTAEA